MKYKTFLGVLSVLLLFGCKTQNLGDQVIANIETECDIHTRVYRDEVSGEEEYNYRLSEYENPFRIETKVKGIIDRLTNSLPIEQELNSAGKLTNRTYDTYKWETPVLKIEMLFSYDKANSSDIGVFHLDISMYKK